MAKIFIDPGHGGRDPGAIGSNSRESDNVLKVAKRLKTLLESYGHTVKLSRSTDKYLTLSERARMANDWGAEYFISLHNNAAVNKSARGFETFIYNRTTNQKTKQFQNAVHDAIALQIGIRDRGMKRANFAVVRETKMPAVLIEYAFISNNEDEKILIEKVDRLAEWTCNGIINAIGGSIKAKPSNPKAKPTPRKTKAVSGRWATIQDTLNKRYGLNIAVDNIPGPETLKAIVKGVQTELNRQSQKGLVVDGIVGPKTRAAFVNVRPGSRGNLTWLLQVALLFKGYDPGAIDGINGSKTQTALKSFQRGNGLTVDGIAGKQTWTKLLA